MEAMSLSELLLEQSYVYQLWQAPFAAQKFAPVIAHNDLSQVHSALDVGCGPGTNSKHFAQTQYWGIDLNARYIATALQRYGPRFEVADARNYQPAAGQQFDFVLINSFLHHLSDRDVLELLSHVRTLLTEDGCVHILEPEMPDSGALTRFLAAKDRGKFVRKLDEWKALLATTFQEVLLETYPLRAAGITLWKMFYFKGN